MPGYFMYNEKFNQLATRTIVDRYGNNIARQSELFVQLIWNFVLVPRYLVSDQGRLYDNKNKFFPSVSYDKDGYHMVSIALNDGSWKKVRLHRFVLMSFDPNPNFMRLVANHKDGNKNNNHISNLEWTTTIENTRHGWEHGLNTNVGENHPNSKYKDEDIHRICKLIDKGLSNVEIMNEFGIQGKQDRMRFSATISGIRQGKVHLPISKQYNFMNGGGYKINYSAEFTYFLCLFLSDGNVYTYRELADLLRIPHNERMFFNKYINDLINGDTGLDITRQFGNLRRPLKQRTDMDYLY